MKNTLQQTKIIALGVLLAAGIGTAMAWTGPTATAPANNTDAPINVGSSTQVKYGNLVLNGLYVNTATILSGILQITSGNPAPGDVLTAQDASGTVGWSSSSGTASSIQAFSVVWGTPESLSTTGWTNTGLSITLAPNSNTSKIYINADINANNDNNAGTCVLGLFRDSTLLVPFANRGGSDSENAVTWGVTYLDTPGDTSSHTYMVKVNPTSYCALNRSTDGTKFASSTMTILEI